MQPPLADSTTSGLSAAVELTVEQVAARLGLPVEMLIRRIESGDVPARRIDGPGGVEYRLRADSLGLDLGGRRHDTDPTAEVAPGPIAPPAELDAPPGAGAGLGGVEVAGRPVDAERSEPAALPEAERHRAELANLGLAAQELVPALLEGWERTVEERLRAEYRVRYETALGERDVDLRRLQSELAAARAELAAALSERTGRQVLGARGPRDSDATLEAWRVRVEEGEARILAAEGEMERLRVQAGTAAGLLADRERRLADRDRVIAARERVILRLRHDVSARDAELAALRDRVAEQEAAIEALRTQPAQRRGLRFRR